MKLMASGASATLVTLETDVRLTLMTVRELAVVMEYVWMKLITSDVTALLDSLVIRVKV